MLSDSLEKAKRSKVMRAIRSKNTRPEIRLRKALWTAGFRFRIQFGPEKIDIAFPKEKMAIFVDGCFWHSCPIHSHIPKSNLDYWAPKLRKNVERDVEKNNRLCLQGWRVIRFWEHDLVNIDSVLDRIRTCLREPHQ